MHGVRKMSGFPALLSPGWNPAAAATGVAETRDVVVDQVLESSKIKLIDAINQGMELGALDNRFVKLAENMMGLVGLTLSAAIGPDERAAFCFPATVDAGQGKLQPGMVLLLEHRLVIAWSEGMLRPKEFSLTFELPAITNVQKVKRKNGRVSAQLDTITFDSGGRHIELLMYSEVIEPRLTLMFEGALDGSVTFTWSDGQPTFT